jgi:hypothetical protein
MKPGKGYLCNWVQVHSNTMYAMQREGEIGKRKAKVKRESCWQQIAQHYMWYKGGSCLALKIWSCDPQCESSSSADWPLHLVHLTHMMSSSLHHQLIMPKFTLIAHLAPAPLPLVLISYPCPHPSCLPFKSPLSIANIRHFICPHYLTTQLCIPWYQSGLAMHIMLDPLPVGCPCSGYLFLQTYSHISGF